jgi:hypothetical protein
MQNSFSKLLFFAKIALMMNNMNNETSHKKRLMQKQLLKGIVLGLLLFLPETSWAQTQKDEESLIKEQHEARRKALEFDQIIAAQIKKTRDTDPFLDALLPYIAFRKQDTAICRTSPQARLCQDKYRWLQAMRNFAQGNCGQVNNDLMKKICQNLSQDTCASLPTGEADLCQGYLQMDLESVRKGIGEPSLKNSFTIEGNTQRAAAKMLSVYMGFKNYNSRFACLKYKDSLNLEQVLACDILFGDEDPYQTLDVIIRDIAMFDLSLMRDDMDLCSGISTQDIKNRCQNPKTRTQRLR